MEYIIPALVGAITAIACLFGYMHYKSKRLFPPRASIVELVMLTFGKRRIIDLDTLPKKYLSFKWIDNLAGEAKVISLEGIILKNGDEIRYKQGRLTIRLAVIANIFLKDKELKYQIIQTRFIGVIPNETKQLRNKISKA